MYLRSTIQINKVAAEIHVAREGHAQSLTLGGSVGGKVLGAAVVSVCCKRRSETQILITNNHTLMRVSIALLTFVVNKK